MTTTGMNLKFSPRCLFMMLLSLTILVCLSVRINWNTRKKYDDYKPLAAAFQAKKTPRPLNTSEFGALRVELDRRLEKAGDKKVILMWYAPFGANGRRDVNREECGNCEVTYDHSKIKDEATTAVVIHFNEISAPTMPSLSERKPWQLHIFWTMESPPSLKNLRGKSLEYEDQYGFNATMSYRRDSDFFTPYGVTSQFRDIFKDAFNSSMDNIMQNRSKTALSLISNCGSSHGSRLRMRIIKEIVNTGFKLEGYGACFGKTGKFPKGVNYLKLVRQYKFFFSFENSHHCRDYITEKFFRNALEGGAVPVVWGATRWDYEAVAPPYSFIHIEDFSSINSLVDYLNYLDRNDTAYLEYFRWYNNIEEAGDEISLKMNGLCQICRALHGINVDDVFNMNYDKATWKRPSFSNGMLPRGTVSIRDWFYNQENPECLRAS